ncbi:hypothetical protein BIW11_04922, partial [Tropilaelaps mercedesae]
ALLRAPHFTWRRSCFRGKSFGREEFAECGRRSYKVGRDDCRQRLGSFGTGFVVRVLRPGSRGRDLRAQREENDRAHAQRNNAVGHEGPRGCCGRICRRSREQSELPTEKPAAKVTEATRQGRIS